MKRYILLGRGLVWDSSTYMMPGNKPSSITLKANALPDILSLWSWKDKFRHFIAQLLSRKNGLDFIFISNSMSKVI